MANLQLHSGMQSGSVSAVITRADGSVEDLGVIAYENRNPFKVAMWEKEKLGKVTEETAMRCAKAAAPYTLATLGAIAGLGYLFLRK